MMNTALNTGGGGKVVTLMFILALKTILVHLVFGCINKINNKYIKIINTN